MFHKALGIINILFPFLSVLLFPPPLQSQNPVKVNIQGDKMEYRKELGPDLRRVIGHVVFEHEGAVVYCDSAYFYESKNSLDAYGNIHIRISDTLNMYGDKLRYDGNTRMADLIGKVKLVDKQTVLTTDHLIYDRNSKEAFYQHNAVITNKNNKLTSIKGYYFTSLKQFFFKDSVTLVNPKYVMHCDTLRYETITRVAFFKGPTKILGKETNIYCENGWYNTNTDIAQFNNNASIRNKSQVLRGDSLYYDREKGIGKAFKNVTITDSVQNIIISGQSGRYFKQRGYSLITDRVLAIMIEKTDSLFLHADTLFTTFDTAMQTNTLSAFHHAKFYRKDLQGLCDSLIYNFRDSTIALYHNPVLWSEENQLTADSIRIWMTNEMADSMLLYNTAFIISKSDTGKFNQVKGRNMTGFFRKNELDHVMVNGNAKTVYFAKEDDGSSIGINIAAASDMLITVKDKKINRIKYLNKPDATLYPEKNVSPSDLILPGFRWFGSRRPINRYEVFTW
ncbi:MAG: hypothetical protein NTU44_01625 [Bacteroidetes bacterium]|nr:hypothetical protein [Bacteroidota bacterium]